MKRSLTLVAHLILASAVAHPGTTEASCISYGGPHVVVPRDGTTDVPASANLFLLSIEEPPQTDWGSALVLVRESRTRSGSQGRVAVEIAVSQVGNLVRIEPSRRLTRGRWYSLVYRAHDGQAERILTRFRVRPGRPEVLPDPGRSISISSVTAKYGRTCSVLNPSVTVELEAGATDALDGRLFYWELLLRDRGSWRPVQGDLIWHGPPRYKQSINHRLQLGWAGGCGWLPDIASGPQEFEVALVRVDGRRWASPALRFTVPPPAAGLPADVCRPPTPRERGGQ